MSQFKTIVIMTVLIVWASVSGANHFVVDNMIARSLDACSYSCDSDENINQSLIQSFSYISASNQAEMKDQPINKIVTADTLVPGDAATTVNKIADRSVKYFWDNSEIKRSSVGRTVETAQKALQKEVKISTGKKEQKLDFAVDAFQSTARIKYSGYTNAELSYQTREASVGLQMIEKLGKNSDLVLSETLKPNNDRMSQVFMNWNW